MVFSFALVRGMFTGKNITQLGSKYLWMNACLNRIFFVKCCLSASCDIAKILIILTLNYKTSFFPELLEQNNYDIGREKKIHI